MTTVLSETFHGQRFSLHTCGYCGLTYTQPVPSDKLLESIYSGEYWFSDKSVIRRGGIASLIHKFNELRLAAMIRPLLGLLPKGAAILEVGCGSGQLAAFMKRKGYNVQVTDIASDIIKDLNDLHGISGYVGDIQDIDIPHTYNAIVFNNVLEHLKDPAGALVKAVQFLKPQGFVFIEVPNIESLQFGLFGKSWFPLKIPEHLFHFSPHSLDNMALEAFMEKVWFSTFSPRISSAGYVASLFPALRPERIRQSWSKPKLFIYLILQVLFLPLAAAEALLGRGSAIRAVYKKK
jgi:SAM-dependent methyltransferase